MRRVIILGATGSIGTTALGAIRTHHLPLKVVGLSAHARGMQLETLGKEFGARTVLIPDGDFSGLKSMLESTDADIVLNGISGFAGLSASMLALESGKDLALANKERVVCGSSFLFATARRLGRAIIPVDSEHSAIYELLKTQPAAQVDHLVITASGGPFRNTPKEELDQVDVGRALHHPTWKMGPKITIDSATLANKAMEVIEASGLFGFAPERIEVTVHPQSVVHSMIRMRSGAVYAQMGNPDMSLPIINALLPGTTAPLVKPLDFTNLSLTFEKPDMDKFPLLALAWDILREGGSKAVAFNAADEVAVWSFLRKEIGFTDIQRVVSEVVARSEDPAPKDLAEAVELDGRLRSLARDLCSRL